MIQPNCKIENLNGIRFYEQDILLDDHVYEDYAEIILNIDYCSPGFGFVLFPDSDITSISKNTECFIFRFGYNDVSVEYKNGEILTTMLHYPLSLFSRDDIDLHNLSVHFKKDKRKVYLLINDNDILFPYYSLPKDVVKYNIGIYSNAGNIIKTIRHKTNIPEFWNINMHNTVGGRVDFYANGFTIDDCKNNAEIEQYNIHPDTPGEYFLNYQLSENSDIKCYVFYSNAQSMLNHEKNILKKMVHLLLKANLILILNLLGHAALCQTLF